MSDLAAGEVGVRSARFALAGALLSDDPPRTAEAVAQLTLAIDEPGGDPPAWRLAELAGAALQDADPAEALVHYLRSLRDRAAPDDVAHRVREWADTRRAGTLRPDNRAVHRLLRDPTTEARRLLGARLLRELGSPAEALDVLRLIDRDDARICVPAQEQEVWCLIELERFDEAARILGDRDRPHQLDPEGRAYLQAWLAYEQKDFAAALGHLERYDGDSAEAEMMRNLALVGSGRASEVGWDDVETGDLTSADIWMSRAVAALDVGDYERAQQAVSRAERDVPESLSVLLLRAQFYLEGDRFAEGLPVLVQVERRARERKSPPFWLARQRLVRRSARMEYVVCEYEALAGRLTVEQIREVDQLRTSYFQDGRLAELEAALHDSGTEDWADALDRGARAYTNAGAAEEALTVAELVCGALPTPARAVTRGWAAYDRYATADPGSPAEAALPRVDAAIAVVELMLDGAASNLTDAIRLITALRAIRIDRLERDTVREGVIAARWALANAVLAIDDVSSQLTAEWLVRLSLEAPAAAVQIAEYAGLLDPGAASVTESRLLARLDLVGADDRTHELLDTLVEQYEQLPADGADTRREWTVGMRLNLALLDGDAATTTALLGADVGENAWAIAARAFAAVAALGLDAAEPFVVDAQRRLEEMPKRPSQMLAYLAALAGDYDAALDHVTAARATGTLHETSVDDDEAVIRYLRDPDRPPLVELLSERLETARTSADIQWWRGFLAGWIAETTGDPAGVTEEVRGLMAARLAWIEANPEPWPDTLTRCDALAGLLGTIWDATVLRDPARLLDAVDEQRVPELSGPLRTALEHVRSESWKRLGDWLLDRVVESLAAGRGPVELPFATVARRSGGPGLLAAVLAGADPGGAPPEKDDQAAWVGALRAAAERHCADGAALWRIVDAVDAMPAPITAAIGDALRVQLLDLLADLAGLNVDPEARQNYVLAMVLGDAFVPEDTGPDWVLFAQYVPDLRVRVERDIGYRLPGIRVRGDAFRPDVLEIEVIGSAVETHVLPVDGMIARAGRPGFGVDPLTGEPVEHVPPGDPLPPGTEAAWTPLEFGMRHVERFVREHLAEIVSVPDVTELAERAGPVWMDRIDDPTMFRGWLAELRRDIHLGGAVEPEDRARVLTERVAVP